MARPQIAAQIVPTQAGILLTFAISRDPALSAFIESTQVLKSSVASSETMLKECNIVASSHGFIVPKLNFVLTHDALNRIKSIAKNYNVNNAVILNAYIFEFNIYLIKNCDKLKIA